MSNGEPWDPHELFNSLLARYGPRTEVYALPKDVDPMVLDERRTVRVASREHEIQGFLTGTDPETDPEAVWYLKEVLRRVLNGTDGWRLCPHCENSGVVAGSGVCPFCVREADAYGWGV